MRPPAVAGGAFANHRAILDEHTAHGRIVARTADLASGERYGAPHVVRIAQAAAGMAVARASSR